MPTVPLPTVPAPLPGIPAWPGPATLPAFAAGPGEGALSQAASGTRAVLSGVAADPRLPGWGRRAFASLAVGATVGVLLDWRLGLLAAVLIVAADVLYTIRTSPVIPARVRAASARRRTRRRLGRAAGSGYRALHARHLAGQGAVIDHLVVGPAGVFAVGSQRWDRRLPVRFTKRGQLFHGPFDQSGQLDRACWQAAQASRLISDALGQPVAVRPALAIYGPAVPWTLISIGGVDVFCGRRLRRYLRHAGSARSGQLLGDRQAELIHTVAAQVLPPARQWAR
jgi:hypothetical protein